MDPLPQQNVVDTVLPRAGSSSVSQLVGRLGHQQAAGRGRDEHATATGFLDQGVVVSHRVETEDRQFEAVLAGLLAVAASTVTAELGEQWHDVVEEMDRWEAVSYTHLTLPTKA